MDNPNGHTMSDSEFMVDIGQPDQKTNPYVPFSTGDKMRRSSGQNKVFDNNGGNSKAGDAGVVNKNAEYGPITYGF